MAHRRAKRPTKKRIQQLLRLTAKRRKRRTKKTSKLRYAKKYGKRRLTSRRDAGLPPLRPGEARHRRRRSKRK